MMLYVGKPPVAECRGKMLPGYALIHIPASFAEFGVRQVDV